MIPRHVIGKIMGEESSNELLIAWGGEFKGEFLMASINDIALLNDFLSDLDK